jgi:hypothetical protein
MNNKATTLIQNHGRMGAAFSAVRGTQVPVDAGFATPIGQRVLRT